MEERTRDPRVKVWTTVGAKWDSCRARLSEEIIKPCQEEERVHVRRDFWVAVPRQVVVATSAHMGCAGESDGDEEEKNEGPNASVRKGHWQPLAGSDCPVTYGW